MHELQWQETDASKERARPPCPGSLPLGLSSAVTAVVLPFSAGLWAYGYRDSGAQGRAVWGP